MKPSYYRITLDIHDPISQLCIPIKKGDKNRKLLITLMDNGAPYEITNGCYALFTAKKQDGNVIVNDCTIKNNIISYQITEQTTAASGMVDCEIVVYKYVTEDYSEKLTSPAFSIIVHDPLLKGNETTSTSEYTKLVNLVAKGDNLVKEVETKLANGDFIGEKGEQGIQGIQGIQGEKGEKGDKGDQGIQGIQGEKGTDGKDGVDGQDGETPYIKNGNWWIGNQDTGVSAQGGSGGSLPENFNPDDYATKEDLDTKLDKAPVSNVNKVYISQGTTGDTVMEGIARYTPTAGYIAQYDSTSRGWYKDDGTYAEGNSGALKTGVPQKPSHAVPKTYLELELAKKVDVPSGVPGNKCVIGYNQGNATPRTFTMGAYTSGSAHQSSIAIYSTNGCLKSPTPIDDGDVATKKYVDDAVANAGGGGSGLVCYRHSYSFTSVDGVIPYEVKFKAFTSQPIITLVGSEIFIDMDAGMQNVITHPIIFDEGFEYSFKIDGGGVFATYYHSVNQELDATSLDYSINPCTVE